MLFPLSAKASIAVGTSSQSDCISRDREFDSGLGWFNSFAEIDHGINSTAPASILFRATIGPPANSIRIALCWRADSSPILRTYWDILLLPLIQQGVSVTNESITQRTGYPLCEACPEKSVDIGTDLLGMRIAVDWDMKQQKMQKTTAYSLACMTHTHARTQFLR